MTDLSQFAMTSTIAAVLVLRWAAATETSASAQSVMLRSRPALGLRASAQDSDTGVPEVGRFNVCRRESSDELWLIDTVLEAM